MYFNDKYYIYDNHTRKTIERRFKNTCNDTHQYTAIGLLKAISEWNRVSVMTMDARYTYYTK